MNVGFVGLGKLGFPVALAAASAGHTVYGFDLSPEPARWVAERRYPHTETHVHDLLDAGTSFTVVDQIDDIVTNADLVFVAVQTPHAPEYAGDIVVDDTRVDFDYGALRAAITSVVDAATAAVRHPTVAVVSTVLPGTFDRELLPIARSQVTLVYNPSFIAMGTVIDDYRNPEFVIVGGDTDRVLDGYYQAIHDAPIVHTTPTTAEAVKVSYNSFITAKIVLANTWSQLCDRVGADVDVVSDCWAMATDRIMSPRYLRAGMSDAGGCHPRDLIALSHVARRENLTFDLFDALIHARESHERWIAQTVDELARQHRLPVRILGRAFKPNTALCDGSAALLLSSILTGMGVTHKQYDPHTDDEAPSWNGPGIYVVATNHEVFFGYPYPSGSVVVDPHGVVAPRPDITVLHLGRGHR